MTSDGGLLITQKPILRDAGKCWDNMMQERWMSDEWVMSDSGCAKLKHKDAEQAEEKNIGNYNNKNRKENKK